MVTRLAVLALGAALLAPAQNPQKASIQGVVTASATGRPLRAARVTLIRRNPDNSGMETSLSPVATDNAGRFSFTGLDAGDYRIVADRDGFIHENGSMLSVTAGQRLTRDFQMKSGGAISGRVLDEEGEPVASAGVNVQEYRYLNGKRVLMPVMPTQVSQPESFGPLARGTTDDRGEYRIFWLPPGEYYVSVTARAQMSYASTADVGTPPVPTERPFLGGYTTPLPETFSSIYFPGVAGPEGASPVSVPASAEVRGIDFAWRPVRKPSVRGRSTRPEDPPPDLPTGRQIGPGPVGGTIVLTHIDGSPGVSTASTSGRGDLFEFRGVAAGSYYVNILERRQDINYFGRTRVDVQDQDVNDVVVTLQPSTNLRGRIVLDSPAPPSFQITQLFASMTTDLAFGGGNSSMRVTEAGNFTFTRVLPTKLQISVNGLPPGAFITAEKYGTDDLLTDPLTPRNDQELEIHISFSSGSVTGSAVDLSGSPSPGTLVTLIPEESKRNRLDLYFTRTTDANGRFNFTSVPAGSYRAFAWDRIPDGAYQSPEFMRPFEGRGTPVRIENGSTENVRLQVIP